MALTKAQQAAKAKAAGPIEAAADTAQPARPGWEADYLEQLAGEGYREAAGVPQPTSYVYEGPLAAVVVVVGDTAYDFRLGEPVHLAHPAPGLDRHPDFRRVPAPEGSGA